MHGAAERSADQQSTGRPIGSLRRARFGGDWRSPKTYVPEDLFATFREVKILDVIGKWLHKLLLLSSISCAAAIVEQEEHLQCRPEPVPFTGILATDKCLGFDLSMVKIKPSFDPKT